MSDQKGQEDFVEIKRDLIVSVNRMEQTINNFKEINILKEAAITKLIEKLERQHNEHHSILFGDPEGKNPGIIAETRECRKDRQDRKRYIGWVCVAAIGSFFTALTSLVVSVLKQKYNP